MSLLLLWNKHLDSVEWQNQRIPPCIQENIGNVEGIPSAIVNGRRVAWSFHLVLRTGGCFCRSFFTSLFIERDVSFRQCECSVATRPPLLLLPANAGEHIKVGTRRVGNFIGDLGVSTSFWVLRNHYRVGTPRSSHHYSQPNTPGKGALDPARAGSSPPLMVSLPIDIGGPTSREPAAQSAALHKWCARRRRTQSLVARASGQSASDQATRQARVAI